MKLKPKIALFAVLTMACSVGYLFFSSTNSSAHSIVPALILDLPTETSLAGQEFRSRVKERYELPMSDTDLKRQLTIDGFDVSADKRIAFFSQSGLVCERIWRVHWYVTNAEVARIETFHGTACL